jgi:beta-glucan synthesis-associated protein KRE6
MLNSWNELCFKGGDFEVSASLAGPAGATGILPGVWTMGNLGRPGYKVTTQGVWPYTYNSCDLGITPNQSAPDRLSSLPGQKLTSCSYPAGDHPSPGTGRGAPEIDILEGSVDPTNRIGVVTQSFPSSTIRCGLTTKLRLHGNPELRHYANEWVYWWSVPTSGLRHHTA